MLLSLMRKHAKSWLIKFLIVIISMVFIFYFGYSFTSDRSAKVALVNGDIITRMEYENTYRGLLVNLQNEYRDIWDDNLIRLFDLRNRALEELIESKLISQEARRLGLSVTDSEVMDAVSREPVFQTDGIFDRDRYLQILSIERRDPKEFEQYVADRLLQQKLIRFLMNFSIISDQDVLDYYRYANERVKLSFVKFAPEHYADFITIEEDLMKEYFEENILRYRVPEKVQLTYININPEQFRNEVHIEENRKISFYHENTDMFTEEEQVRARHILFRLTTGSSPEEKEEVRERAVQVLQKARDGEDFEELARNYSEGPTSDVGGDLGYFPRGRMVTEFEDAAFALKPGQVSDLVETSFGYHLIKVEDVTETTTKPLDEVRDQIENLLVRNESLDLAHRRANNLISQLPYDIDLALYAEQHGFSASSTNLFSRNRPAAVFSGNERLLDTIFSLEKNDTTELIEVQNSFYIFQVSDKQESYLPELEEVAEQVREDYQQYLELLMARSEAENYLEALKDGSNWYELLEEQNRTSDTTGFFNRQGSPDRIGQAPGIQETAFSLNEKNRYPDTIFENEKGAFVIRWEEKEDIDESEFEKDKQIYREALMRQKQEEAFMAWVNRLKENAEIDRSNFRRLYN